MRSPKRLPTPEEIFLWQNTMSGSTRLNVEQIPNIPNIKIDVNRPVETSGTVDLHGMTVAEAHNKVFATLDLWRGKTKFIIFITGQSGIIHREFSHWATSHIAVKRVETMNGGGAFKVFLRRR